MVYRFPFGQKAERVLDVPSLLNLITFLYTPNDFFTRSAGYFPLCLLLLISDFYTVIMVSESQVTG